MHNFKQKCRRHNKYRPSEIFEEFDSTENKKLIGQILRKEPVLHVVPIHTETHTYRLFCGQTDRDRRTCTQG